MPFAMILSPAAARRRRARRRRSGCSRSTTITSSGARACLGHPTRFGGTPAQLGTGSPGLGEHTDAILEELGIGDDISDLRATGVVA